MAAKSDAKNRFLRNYIKQADTHNRVQEEREMWRQRALELQSQLEHIRPRRCSPVTRGHLLSDTLDDTSPSSSSRSRKRRGGDDSPVHSSYWTRQLMKAEEFDTHRWGHSGYKELYPEEFISTDEEENGEKEICGKKLKTTKLSKRKERKKRHKLPKKKARLSTSTTTSSGNSDSEQEEVRKRRKKKRRKERRQKD